MDKRKRLNAYIIQMSDNIASLEKGLDCLSNSSTRVNSQRFEATQPSDIYRHIDQVFGKQVAWSWSTRTEDDDYCLYTGLYKKMYPAVDQNRVIACALSHYRLWKLCVELDEEIVILEHDARFLPTVSSQMILDILQDKSWGAVGLNDPRGNTRKGQLFHAKVAACGDGINRVPIIDEPTELPLPMGLAGNSAYIIRPNLAKRLLDEVVRIGMWPNDAVMCRQLFRDLKVVYPYLTNVERGVSTTTGL
jgi:GR25 family glycosyltransferase involved in LPS biosynthesis